MSGHAPPPAAPAAFLRRYAAWSLDMAVLAAAAALACAPRIGASLARAGEAFDALALAVAQAMVDALLHGAAPAELARQWLDDPARRGAVGALAEAVAGATLPPLLLAALLALAWFPLFEASPWRATPGKRALGLRVAGGDGARIGPARAAARQLAGALSWLTLNIGHLLALAPPRRQALHDRIAGARVLQAAAGARLPGWAIAWLCLQLALAAAATAWLFIAANAAMQRAFDALL